MTGKILVIQTAFLGDALLTLPLIQHIKSTHTNALIDVLCIPSTQDIFKHSPYVNQVIVYDKRRDKIFGLIKIINEIKKNRYQKIYSPHRSFRTAMIIYFSGVDETYGFDTASLNLVYKNKIEYRKNSHEVERNLSLVGFDNSDWRILPELSIPKEALNKIDLIVNGINEKIIAIAPGSVWDTKIYPKEYYKEICRYLISKNFMVFLIGSKEDKSLCEEILQSCPTGCFSLAGSLSIIESIAFLKKCSLLICNDSAPTHMAMAADIPAITIYCSTISEFGFYPYNKKSLFLSYNELNCKPCGIHGHKKCPIKTFDCGFLLKPSRIIEKVDSILTSEKN
ncbi:MAG: glycosyltransferase family 9 protein [Bacteroidota bacterium]